MAIDDLVLYKGRLYFLRGIDPMSVSDRRALLEDAETREPIRVPLAEVEDVPDRAPDGNVWREEGLS